MSVYGENWQHVSRLGQFCCHKDHCILMPDCLWKAAQKKEKMQGNINTSTLAAAASGRASMRSRKPPQYASCESWSMPQRNPIKCRVLLKVNLGHGRYCQYYCHFSRVEWFKYWIPVWDFISRSDDCAFFLSFFFSGPESEIIGTFYFTVAADQVGQHKKKKTLEPSAWDSLWL